MRRSLFVLVAAALMPAAGPVLPYGESIRKGRFVCASEEVGVRCVHRRNGHGFLLSRQRVRLF
jgi:hypothetical protein